jgi:RNA polymerase sigma-70 factor (ECF subfamily)
MRDMTLTDVERLGAFDQADRTFQMDEDAFRAFYELTARPLWAYLARTTGDSRLADDLLQESYYRLLRTRTPLTSDDHRRHYLFRIATNLIRDHWRRPEVERYGDVSTDGAHADGRAADRAATRIDLARAMKRLKPRERSLLWLAYAQGWSHEEIAASLGLKTASLKCLLHRARRRLAGFLTAPQKGGGR